MAADGPRPEAADRHYHPEYWTEQEHHRFEERLRAEVREVRKEVRGELSGIRASVNSLNNRLTLLMGAVGILAFLLPILAPFIRQAIGQ